MKTNSSNRKSYFDLLNIICCLAVIVMHHNEIVHYADHSSPEWIGSNIANTICIFAVPVFFMLSGATLIGYKGRYDTKTYYIRRIKRTVIPFIFWSIIWFLFCVFIQEKNDFLSIRGFIDGLINTKFTPVYWFFYPLFALYLVIPLFTYIDADKEGRKILNTLLIVIIIFEALIIPILSGINIPLNQTFVNGIATPVLYGLLGCYLSSCDVPRNLRHILYAVAILLVCLKCFLTSYNNYILGSLSDITTIIESSALFLFAKHISISPTLSLYLQRVSKCSFGVFLIHMFIVYAEKHCLTGILSVNSFLWRIPMALCTYLISLVIVQLIKKIPHIGTKIV